MCVCDLFIAYTHGDLGLWPHPKDLNLVASAQNLSREKSQDGHKAWHTTVAHTCGDHAPACLKLSCIVLVEGEGLKKEKKKRVKPSKQGTTPYDCIR